MKATTPSKLINQYTKKIGSAQRHHTRKIKGLYAKFLEFLLRKTEADRRIELFGSDPLR